MKRPSAAKKDAGGAKSRTGAVDKTPEEEKAMKVSALKLAIVIFLIKEHSDT